MDRIEIRSLIKSILAEELEHFSIKNSLPRREKNESVKIMNNEDLADFVKRIAELCEDKKNREGLRSGHWKFTLNSTDARHNRPQIESSGYPTYLSGDLRKNVNNNVKQFDKGFINEREVDALNDETKTIIVRSSVRFTPLARDRLRQRGISIERKSS